MRHGAILLLCLLLVACDRKPAEGPSVHLAAPATCANDWTKCADNSALARENADWKNVPGLCQKVTEAQLQYGTPQWGPTPFATTLPGNIYITSGKAVAIDPDVKFVSADQVLQAKIVCEYDLKLRTVTNLYVLPH